MVLGIVGILFFAVFGFLVSVAAVITGHIAQRSQPYAKGFWITGLITGYVGIGISLLFGLVFLLIAIGSFASYSSYGY
jgi:hypothetical protein